MDRKLVTGAIVFSFACAAPAVETVPTTPPAPEPSLHRIADPAGGGVRSLVLEPSTVERVIGPSPIAGRRFKMGAVYASRGRGDYRTHNLGLVIEASCDSAQAVFRTDRRFLLEVDGRVFMSPPPNPRLYSVRKEDGGLTEVIMIPVSHDMLQRFVEGDVVRGRLGRWTTLEFSKEERDRFARLLGALPSDAEFDSKKKVKPARLPRTVTGG